MLKREEIRPETPWDSKLSYSRAVRIGSFVALSQTSAVDSQGNIQGGNSPYDQAVYALKNVRAALSAVRCEIADIIRTRIYLSSLDDWEAVARAHSEFLGDLRPAVSLIECRMVSEDILVEFEVDAIVDQ